MKATSNNTAGMVAVEQVRGRAAIDKGAKLG